jgi:hypothetical protein
MAKEKAHTDRRGWFARWRERRTRSKLRATEITRRLYDERSRDAEREARTGSFHGGGG